KLVTSSENARSIAASLEAINQTVNNLAGLSGTLAKENDEIKNIIHNTNNITASFAKNGDTIRRILSNFNNVSNQLANAHIQQTFNELQGSVTQLQDVMKKMNSNDGSLGLLINNKDLYNNMNSSIKSIDRLMTDLKEHPSRYVNVTIFGRKKKD
ncbi:MAG: MCE family protein, partial [Taibaiella sp.]|nr:MCE family protein [Taibaiella sp.]